MPPMGQFQVLNQKTGETEVYLKHQLPNLRLAEDVYGRPGGNGVKGTWVAKIFAQSKEEQDEMVAMLVANGIAFVPGEPFAIPEPIAVPLLIEGEVTTEHRQAHAKIFLNLIAHYLGRDEAMKTHWDFLRRYARFGEGAIKYRITGRPQEPNNEEGLQDLISGSIVIQILNYEEHVVGTIRFYGNETYEYLLREHAAIPDEDEFGFMFTDGKEPTRLVTGKNLLRAAMKLVENEDISLFRWMFDTDRQSPVDLSDS